VRAAWNRDYLMLVIPSKHAALFYKTDPQSITRYAWINYGPLLMLPTGYNTNPSPQDTFRMLPELQKKQIDDEQKKAEEARGDQPKETPKSDCWVCAAQNDTFVLVDSATNRVMSFQCTGKQMILEGVRNLTYELKLPEGYTYQSMPPGAQTLTGFVNANRSQIKEAGLEAFTKDEYLMRALVKVMGTPKGAAAAGAGGLQAATLDDKVVLDFTAQHKLILLNPTSGSLDLVSLRDYTLDLAASSLAEILSSRNAARTLVLTAQKNNHSHTVAMNSLQFALKLDPSLVDAVEKDKSFVPELSKNEGGWAPMLDTAHKDKDAQVEKMKSIADLAKKMKEDDEALLHPPKKDEAPAPKQ
jgi:hypothetical protein